MDEFKVTGRSDNHKTVGIRFDEDTYIKIANIANENNVLVADLIRQMVTFAMDRYPD